MVARAIPAVVTGDGLLGWCFCLCMVCLVLWRMYGRKLASFIAKFGKRLTFRRRSSDGEIVTAGIFVVLVLVTLGIRAAQMSNAHVYEYYHVKVLRQVAPNKWWMSKDDGEFLYTGCPDFPNATVIWAGYEARKARWMDFGSCKSIERADLGFWWDRDDENKNARRIQ